VWVGRDKVLESLRVPLGQLPAGLMIPALSSRARGGGSFEVEMRTPGSKSLGNRALLLAALAEGTSELRGMPLDADDPRTMTRAVEALGAKVERLSEGVVRVTGVGGTWRVGPEGVAIDVGNAGTVARFLAASALLADGPVTLDGTARMRERPIGQLAEMVASLGAKIEYLGRPGCVPMRITPPVAGVKVPPILDVWTTQSSQFVSALLQVAPWLDVPMTMRLHGSITSASYVAMTLGLLGKLGATVQYSDNMRVMRISAPRDGQPRTKGNGPGLRGFEYEVEPDASGATYFWGAAAMVPGAMCRIVGIGEDSLQGDARFPGLLERMGARVVRRTPTRGSMPADSDGVERFIECHGPAALKPVLADMSEMPDAVMTLAVVASMAQGVSILRGVRTLRVKESDRIAALTRELAKVGVKIDSPVSGDDDVLTITPPAGGMRTDVGAEPIEFETYDDHRMAMSLALIGLRRPGVLIKNPACVQKTYPEFWRHFAGLYA
jgi:3-phosphoshikimate 1-carboxyvinyltransferase